MSDTPEISDIEHAINGPGVSSSWSPGNKQMVGTSLGPSRVWFTVGQGILNEVYFPRIDIPQIRDLGFIVCDSNGFWVEIKTLKNCTLRSEPGASATVIEHQHEYFTFTQRIVPEPDRDSLLIETQLNSERDLQVFVLLAPHLGGTANNNEGFVTQAGLRNVLCAKQGPFALALAGVQSNSGENALSLCSAAYCGTSDLWQQFNRGNYLKETYQQAGPGSVALSAQIPSQSTLALGFANSMKAASTLAVSSLLQPFETIWQKHHRQWSAWQKPTSCPTKTARGEDLDQAVCDQIKISAMVLRTHFDQNFRGAMVASLSVPWGNFADERPGYHLVWPRDLTECAGAFLALGAQIEARDILRYLIATQKDDGSWNQNQWLGGTPFWTNLQLDQVAFPVLLAGMIADKDALEGIYVKDMVAAALRFLVRYGPVSPQDRWEESSGTNPFTLSVMIAALVSGARFLNEHDAQWALLFADYWNTRLEDWTSVDQSKFIEDYGLKAHYVKVVPEYALEDRAAMQRPYPIKNRSENFNIPAADQIACDFLQLVRFGIRSSASSVIQDTLLLVDKTLKKDFPQGPSWHRYTLDGYGEHGDGSPYDETGIGRPWPLLTGERGHYELCADRSALQFIEAMQKMSVGIGMLPEQLWNENDDPANNLEFGKETGSATPLAWAHAEFIKLVFSAVNGAPVDRPEPVWQRYQGEKPKNSPWLWSCNAPFRKIPASSPLHLIANSTEQLILKDSTLPEPISALGLNIYSVTELIQERSQLEFTLLDGSGSTDFTIEIQQESN